MSRVSNIGASRLVSMIRRIVSVSCRSKRTISSMPALLTRMSIWPNAARARLGRLCRWSESVISALTTSTSTP